MARLNSLKNKTNTYSVHLKTDCLSRTSNVYSLSGYRISKSRLNAETGIEGLADSSSIKLLAAKRVSDAISFDDLVRGSPSLGSFLEQQDVITVPSPANRSPESGKYLVGSSWLYNQYRDLIDMIQMYAPFKYRNSPEAIDEFAGKLASAVAAFYQSHYGNY